MKTPTTTLTTSSASPAGESFDEYFAGVQAGLEVDGRKRLEHLRARYSLASQLISLRKRNGLTQIDLAKRAKVNQSDISRLERGSANVSQASLERIAQVFGAGIGFVDSEGQPIT